ncbi:LuxR C-terminal-related transcriptional regulator [Halopseudomonas bauzanensis]|uniref:LuxR C-terminal-related transcriptional regulator n=1 Tax=Halopseudomonas bauzanensis TaxID=653930 RepID=UPI002557973D|nr:LuxR C-terminal-related transcriptional regulator [Halopseudomonas bauzanensis]
MNSPTGFKYRKNSVDIAFLDHALATPVVQTRLRPPQDLSPTLPRPRLEDRLLNVERYRVALINAPAGFGKTTLMRQLHDELKSRDTHVGWLSLNSDDNSLPQFMLSLLTLLESLPSQWRVSLRDIFARDTSPQFQMTMAYLLNELTELRHPVVLLLDDIQTLTSPTTQARLQYLLDNAPDNLRVCLGTRCTTELSLTPLRYRGQLLECDARELAFTAEEARDYFTLRNGLGLPDDALQQLMDLSEGWATGLQMLATSATFQLAPGDALKQLREGVRVVSRFFDDIVLSSLPAPIHDFLLKTSILDELSADICNALTQRQDAEDILHWLVSRNLFITLVDEQTPSYRLHQLFAETLQARLLRSREHDVAQLHMLASQHMAQAHQWPQAIRHALQTAPGGLLGQDLSDLEAGARNLAEQGDLDILLRWLRQLPKAAYTHSLRLQLTLAWVLAHHFRFAECHQLLEDANVLASSQGPQGDTMQLEIRAVAAVCAVLADDPLRAEHLLEPLLPRLSDLPPWIAGLICNGLSSSYLAQGRHGEVLDLQRQQPLDSDSKDNLLVTLYRASILGQVYMRQADPNTAGRFFLEALARAENATGSQSNGAIILRAHLAELLHERRQWSELTAKIEPELALIEHTATLDGLLKVYRSLIRGHGQQPSGRAEQLIEQGLHLARQRHWPRFSAGMLSEDIHLKLARGHLAEAQLRLTQLEQLRDTHDQLAPSSCREINELITLHHARLAMHHGDYLAASRQLGPLARQLLQRGRVLAWLQLETLRLCCDWKLGRQASAMAGLLPLLQRGAQQQLRQSFVESSPILVELLQAVGTSPGCTDTLRTYIKELLGYFPQQGPIGSPPPSEPLLSEREQEVLAMVATGSANKVIARSLAISAETVKWHLKNIFLKLQVSNRMQALIRAQELGLIPDQSAHQNVTPPSMKSSAPTAKLA